MAPSSELGDGRIFRNFKKKFWKVPRDWDGLDFDSLDDHDPTQLTVYLSD